MAVGWLVFPLNARAAVENYTYTGQVDVVFGQPIIDGIPVPFDGVQVGDPILVEYTLDTATADFTPAVAGTGTFSGAFMNYMYRVTIGDAIASTALGGVNTLDADNLPNQNDTYAAIGIYEGFTTSVSLMDSTNAAVAPGDTLEDIQISDFDSADFVLLVGAFPGIQGTLQPVEVVPEPNALSLVGLGLLSAIAAGRYGVKCGSGRLKKRPTRG